MCVGEWSLLNLVDKDDGSTVAELPDIEDDVEEEDGWDYIDTMSDEEDE